MLWYFLPLEIETQAGCARDFSQGARTMDPKVIVLIILMALVAPWVKTLTRELFILLRSLFHGEAMKDESLFQRVSSELGPGDVDKRSLSE